MASVKKQVKKRRKQLEPSYKGLTRKEKKVAKAEFEDSLKAYKKTVKKKKRRRRLLVLFLLNNFIGFVVVWRMFHSRASKKYKRQELGRR